MASKKRIIVPGQTYHITDRGNHQEPIFRDEEDRKFMKHVLSHYGRRFEIDHKGFSFMGNHLHLLSVPTPSGDLSRLMQVFSSMYALYFNEKYRATGHLWERRFYAKLVPAALFWDTLRYVECNPVEAGIVKSAWDYQWSSARVHVGEAEDGFVSPWPEGVHTHESWKMFLEEYDPHPEAKLEAKLRGRGLRDGLLHRFFDGLLESSNIAEMRKIETA